MATTATKYASLLLQSKKVKAVALGLFHIHVIDNKIYLLSIYDKSEQADISDKDLDNWLMDTE